MKQLLIILFLSFATFAKVKAQYIYLNPHPEAQFVNPTTTLAITCENFIDEESLTNNNFIVVDGTSSGNHLFTSQLSDDGKTIIVKILQAFDYDEKVTVSILSNKLKVSSGSYLSCTSYSFHTRNKLSLKQEKEYNLARIVADEDDQEGSQQSTLRDENLDSIPTYTILSNTNPDSGEIFYRNVNNFLPIDSNCFTTITENDGTIKWARHILNGGTDFKINYSGYLTYFNDSSKYWMVLDSNYSIKDSLTAGNGFGINTNSHDISLYSDGHALIMAYDIRTVDMTAYGGKANATVTGLVIQELDAAKNVIWEWNAWDYFNVTDAASTVIITGYTIDYVHGNAISRDTDGNILLSSRNMDEVTKINRANGDIIWRLNGENNQFTFVDDNIPEHFAHQHDARRIANGHLTLFNNGNFLSPQKSSAKEYEIDEVNKVATLKWYYEHPDLNGIPVYGGFMGNAQRLSNGNTLIDWGAPSSDPNRPSFTEVDSMKNIVWEMKFDKYGVKSYRAHKYVWNPCEMPKPEQLSVTKITDSSAKVNWSAVNNAISYDVEYKKLAATKWTLKNTTTAFKKLKNLKAGKSYEFHIRTHCANGYISDWTPRDTFQVLYARVEQQIHSRAVSLYPNPVADLLTLELNLDFEEHVSVSIHDLAGKELLSKKYFLNSGTNLLKLDVNNLPPAMYFIILNYSKANSTLKFTKE